MKTIQRFITLSKINNNKTVLFFIFFLLGPNNTQQRQWKGFLRKHYHFVIISLLPLLERHNYSLCYFQKRCSILFYQALYNTSFNSIIQSWMHISHDCQVSSLLLHCCLFFRSSTQFFQKITFCIHQIYEKRPERKIRD